MKLKPGMKVVVTDPGKLMGAVVPEAYKRLGYLFVEEVIDDEAIFVTDETGEVSVRIEARFLKPFVG